MKEIAAGVLLLALMASPIIVLLFQFLAVKHAALEKRTNPVEDLVFFSISYAILASLAVIGLTIWYMLHYESTTGYSAGNAPLALFYFLPAAVAFGQSVALIEWWFGKKR